MKIKTVYKLALIVAAIALFVTSIPLQASKTDDRIAASAKDSYVFRTYLKDDGIKVQSKDGIVTLTGSVSEESHKSMAEETVESLPGVKSVNNQLSVTGSPAGANSDAWLGERVRGTLLFHRSVSYVNTNVSVTDGKVTLRGTASSEAQKQLTTEYAKDVSGIKDVDNQMTVANAPSKSHRSAGEKIDDASITTQVRMSLLFHHGTDVFDTKVSTHKGVVTLSGSAKNQAEIDLATKRVSDVHGVTSVINQMTIEAVKTSSN
jgi:hyperosmotically inducible periplasmic protein